MRLRADKTIKDDLPQVRPWLALQPGESAITGIHEAELTFEADSDQHYAARIVSEFRVFQRAIRKPHNKEFALYLAARLRELVGEWELSPEMRREAQRVRGLRELNASRKELGQERKSQSVAASVYEQGGLGPIVFGIRGDFFGPASLTVDALLETAPPSLCAVRPEFCGTPVFRGWEFDSGFARIEPTPEPTTLLLFGTTGAGLGLARWYRRRRRERAHAA